MVPPPAHDEAVDAHRFRTLFRLREEAHDQRERDRRHHRAAESLHGTARHEQLLRRRQTAEKRGECEDAEADQEHAPMAIEIAQPAA